MLYEPFHTEFLCFQDPQLREKKSAVSYNREFRNVQKNMLSMTQVEESFV